MDDVVNGHVDGRQVFDAADDELQRFFPFCTFESLLRFFFVSNQREDAEVQMFFLVRIEQA